jgi:adenosylhomocysteine nucleosidase
MLVIFGALDEEISSFRSTMAVEDTIIYQSGRVYRGSYQGKNLLLVNHGVGKRRASTICRWVVDHYPVSAIVSLGFAGALKPDFRTGDMFICSCMICADDPTGTPHEADSILFTIAKECKINGLSYGTGVSTNRPVSLPADKHILGESSSADIVDMESYWIASIASEYGLPLIVGRAISDAVNDTLPVLTSYTWNKTTNYLIRHPIQGWTLYRGMSRAKKSLTVFAIHMVKMVA